jgi:hypothetical protein
VVKRKKNILVLIFTWAGLLLAILYSPIGSPELYMPIYSVANQNVDFNGGSIENAKDVNFESGNDYSELNVPDYNSEESSSKLSSDDYSYAATSNDHSSSNATSYSSSESQSYQSLRNGSSGSNINGGTFISNSGSGGSSASSAVTMSSGGITTLSSDLAMAPASKIKNPGVQYDPNNKDGGQHPGKDPDPKTAIPVPDGWMFLLFLAASYGIIKKKIFMA